MSFEPRFSDLATMLQDVVGKHGPRPAFGERQADRWVWTRYAELGALIDACRGGLAALGVQRGDRVAVISNNRLEWVVAEYAAVTLGAVYVAMYESQLDADWRFILGDSGARVCFVAGDQIAARVRPLASELAELGQVIDFDDPGEGGWASLLARGRATPRPPIAPRPDDDAVYIYTSGTTGQPKGVRLSHGNIACNVSGVQERVPFLGSDRALSFLPWAHVYGGSIELPALMSIGAQAAICGQRERILPYLEEVQPTVMFAVPQIWNRIYAGVRANIATKPAPIRWIFEHGMSARSKRRRGEPLAVAERVALPLAEALVFKKIRGRFGGHLKFAVSGGAALSPEVGEFIDNLGVQVFEGYGMTESGGVIATNYPGTTRIGTVGPVLPGIEVKIDRSALGSDGENGEIIVYGRSVMRGYHNQPEATQAVMTADGGLRTGDLGRFDRDGFLIISGRVKELYKLQNGKYVAPAPLEEQLTLSPYLQQVMLYGADRPYNVAVVVPNRQAIDGWAKERGLAQSGDALLATPELRALLTGELERLSQSWKSYERVKSFVIAKEEFTTANDLLTPSMKVKRRNVLKCYTGDIDKLYT